MASRRSTYIAMRASMPSWTLTRSAVSIFGLAPLVVRTWRSSSRARRRGGCAQMCTHTLPQVRRGSASAPLVPPTRADARLQTAGDLLLEQPRADGGLELLQRHARVPVVCQLGAAVDGEPQPYHEQWPYPRLSLIHISEPTRLGMISYAVFCLKK